MAFIDLGVTPDALLNAAPSPHYQINDFACWACSARHIYGFKPPSGHPTGKFANPNIASDLDFSLSAGLPLNICRSLIDILANMGYGVDAEKKRVPHVGEIDTAIAAGTPLACCIGDDAQRSVGGTARDLAFAGGHWVVIVGVDSAAGDLAVFEPFAGMIYEVKLEKMRCNIPNYLTYSWQNTSYID
jgi:hypothetical protein